MLLEISLSLVTKPTSELNFRKVERTIIRHSQFLLKEEWEKVKVETRAWPCRLTAKVAACRRSRGYAAFCDTEASYVSHFAKNKSY